MGPPWKEEEIRLGVDKIIFGQLTRRRQASVVSDVGNGRAAHFGLTSGQLTLEMFPFRFR